MSPPLNGGMSSRRSGNLDAELNPPGSAFTVIMNSAEAGGAVGPTHPIGSQLPVRRTGSGIAYVEISRCGAKRGAGAPQPTLILR